MVEAESGEHSTDTRLPGINTEGASPFCRMTAMILFKLMAAAMVTRVYAFSTPKHNFIESHVCAARLDDVPSVDDYIYDTYNLSGSVPDRGIPCRRRILKSLSSTLVAFSVIIPPWKVIATDDTMATTSSEVQVVATGDVKKLFNDGRALEAQGNILAAQRLYIKVTKIAPRFIYGWSNLGNTLVAQGQLKEADESYSNAIDLCEENLKQADGSSFGTRRCDDLYLILLNRGSVRLNSDRPKEALLDLTKSSVLRGRPDATILQNLVRNMKSQLFLLSFKKS